MVSLDDIFNFMKQEKDERAKQRVQDMEERVKQREQDMDVIKEMINKGVNAEVIAVIEPISLRQEKMEVEYKLLKDQLKEIMNEFTDLKKKCGIDDQLLGSTVHNVTYGDEEDSIEIKEKEISEVEDIVSSARRTVGLQCVYQEDVERQTRLYGAKDETEARIMAAKEFLWCEMKVSGKVFDRMEVVKIFPTARDNWNTLYLEFASESSVQIIYKNSRHLKRHQRLVSYIPKQLYTRFQGLEETAYNLRHSSIKYKTRVKIE